MYIGIYLSGFRLYISIYESSPYSTLLDYWHIFNSWQEYGDNIEIDGFDVDYGVMNLLLQEICFYFCCGQHVYILHIYYVLKYLNENVIAEWGFDPETWEFGHLCGE